MNVDTDHFQKLDKEIICYISSWLEVNEIINFGLTYHYLKFLLKAKSVWNLQIKNYLPRSDLISDKFPKLSPKDLFIQVFSKFNKLVDLLSQIIQKVNANMNARKWLEDNYKKNYDKRKDLENIISESYHCIPADYYMFFRLLDGQDMLFQHFPQDVCFFGGYSFNEKYYEFEYLPFTQPEFPLLEKLKFHTIAINRDRGIRYYVDFDNILKGGVGSIFTFLSQRNENGTIIFRIFIIKQSIFKLLQDLQPCTFSLKKRLIDHFDTLCSPQSDVTTEGIRIRAYSIFNPWEMSSSGFLFAYQIRVSANGLKGKWKLTCRHLIITDGNNQEEVEGVEVNGKAYEVYDKGEDLLYESWVYTQSLTTTMKGYLYFVNVDTNQEVRAQIGEILMEFPYGCALLDFKQKDLSIKVLIDRMETEL